MEAREKGETPDDFDVVSVSSNSDRDEQDKKKRASLFQAIAQCIANRWKALPSEERVKFEELAKEEMKKYRIKKDEYQQRMVRETLDLSNRSASAAAASLPLAQAGLPAGLAGLYHPSGLLGSQLLSGGGYAASQAPAVGILSGQQSLGLQEYLQRQALAGGDRFLGAGFLGQDPRLSSLQFAGAAHSVDRLLALRALQAEAGLRPGLFQSSGGGYLGGLSAGLDPRLVESLGGIGGLGAAGGTASAPLSDLPPEELLRLLRQQQGGQPPHGA